MYSGFYHHRTCILAYKGLETSARRARVKYRHSNNLKKVKKRNSNQTNIYKISFNQNIFLFFFRKPVVLCILFKFLVMKQELQKAFDIDSLSLLRLKMISSPYCALSRVCFVSCKTSQKVNILQLLT